MKANSRTVLLIPTGYSLAAYLSGFFDCGAYVDFVGRIGRLSTDITAYSDASEFKGSYNNTTFGLSAEVGYHWKLNDTFYVEPQAELAYGFVKGDDFTGANDVRVEQDDFQTLVGRLGARIGASFADGAGTVYAHASVNHDFLGDADYTASLGASPVISALTSAELGFPTVSALSSTRRRTSISTARLNARTVRNIKKTTVIRSA